MGGHKTGGRREAGAKLGACAPSRPGPKTATAAPRLPARPTTIDDPPTDDTSD